MSSQDDIPVPNSGSFWEVDCYKRTVKRTEDGFLMCGELMKMTQERSDIEKDYAKKLKAWSKKWVDFFDKSLEYGTAKAALKGSLEESEKVADVHLKIKDGLLNYVQMEVKEWRNENYKKQMMGACKEAKVFEEDFKRVQKPWSKRLDKVVKCKKDYHTACKLEKTATNQESNAKNSSEVSLDQLRKFQERVDKSKKEVILTREKYQQSLLELNAYNGRYIEDMAEVFQKTQEFEEKRLKFLKNVLYKIHDCLDLTKFNEIPMIYKSLYQVISTVDNKKDLKWWSENHGADMQMTWHTFEEYATEFHNISNKERSSKNADGAVLLTSIQKSDEAVTAIGPSVTSSYHSPSNSSPSRSRLNSIPEDDDTLKPTAETIVNGPNEMKMLKGVTVRALYDYESQEKDELSFNTGDIFLKLRDKDEQGWCTGCKDGRAGLYPDSYVELLSDAQL